MILYILGEAKTVNSEKGHPEISVIVPVYNVEKYLKACIDSILSQTYQNFELILVDDGSTDKSPQICDDYAQKDERIQVFHQTNQGQSAARNFGVSKSVGTWIHFVDSDDLIHPQMLELLYRAVYETGAKISISAYIYGDSCPEDFFQESEYNVKTWEVSDETVAEYLSEEPSSYWFVWGKLVERKIVEENLFEPGRIGEDTAVICKWIYQARLIAETDSILYFYTRNICGTMMKKWSPKKLDLLWSNNENILFYKRIKYEKCCEIFVKRQIIDMACAYRNAKKISDPASIKLLLRTEKTIIRYHHIWRRISFNDRIYVFGLVFPKLAGGYWLYQALCKKIREKGFAEAFKSALARMKGRTGGNES